MPDYSCKKQKTEKKTCKKKQEKKTEKEDINLAMLSYFTNSSTSVIGWHTSRIINPLQVSKFNKTKKEERKIEKKYMHTIPKQITKRKIPKNIQGNARVKEK